MDSDQKQPIGEDQIYNSKIWELPIFSIKFADPKNGMGFYVGQELRGDALTGYTVTSIIRSIIEKDTIYMIFGEKDGETKLLKASIGIDVYLTFKI